MDQQSLRELVGRARRRDAAAFGRLIESHERAALAVAFAILGDPSAAGDAVQEAFLKMWQRLPELKEPERFSGWCAQVVRNAALDARRRQRGPAAAQQDVHAATLPPLVHDPAAGLEQAESRDRLDAALAELDELTRTIVVLRYYDNLNSQQIGAMLDLSAAAVDMRLWRARNELRQRLCPADANE
jgi:RNA polymerase sigma-70 factor (ECF subfamily)